jgi:hypothetical protein
VGHSSYEDLRVHSRDLEGILLPSRVECIDGMPQVMLLREIPARQRLPTSVGHCLSTHRSRSGTSVLAHHLQPIGDLHYAIELHAPWSQNTLNLGLWALVMPI